MPTKKSPHRHMLEEQKALAELDRQQAQQRRRRREAAHAALGEQAAGLIADLLNGSAPEWQEGALCAQTDPEVFFPEKGGSVQAAKRICWRCDVRTDCLQYALGTGEPFGIWGGLTGPERRKLASRVA